MQVYIEWSTINDPISWKNKVLDVVSKPLFIYYIPNSTFPSTSSSDSPEMETKLLVLSCSDQLVLTLKL